MKTDRMYLLQGRTEPPGRLALTRWVGCPPVRWAVTSNVEGGSGNGGGGPRTLSQGGRALLG